MKGKYIVLLLSISIVLTGCKAAKETNEDNGKTFVSAIPTPTPAEVSVTSTTNENTSTAADHEERPGSDSISTTLEVIPSTWTTLSNTPEELVGPGFAAVNGKLYLIGGGVISNDQYSNSNKVYEYDTSAKTWTEKSPMPTVRDSFGTVVIGADIYTIGGYTLAADGSITELAISEKYDTIMDQWSSIADMNYPRAKLCVAESNGKIYAIGGMGSNRNKVEVYDPAFDQWIEKKDTRNAWRRAGTAVVNGKIYCISGEVPNGTDTVAAVEEYDPENDIWVSKCSIPTPRTDMAVVTVDGMIYVMGGWTRTGILNSVQIYDPRLDQWTNGPKMTGNRYYHAAVAIDNLIYVAGGSNMLPAVFNSLEVYNCQ